MRAYMGCARALIDAHVPFEYVTADELLEGIALYYPVLYLPHLRAASVELMDTLINYVQKGGRLVADVQVGFEDQWGKLHRTGPGGLQDQAFGAYVDTIHDARTAPVSVNDIPVEGFYGTLVPTTAKVLARFDDGQPAITQARVGQGTAILIGFDAARMCWQPGQDAVEALVAAAVWGGDRSGWSCDAPMAFRRSSSQADHYFLLNDGDARAVWLTVYDRTYGAGEYVLEGKPIDTAGTIAIDLPARSAVWCRFSVA
jgi:beta-galactosidase